MTSPEQEKKQAAIKALINIAILEGFVLIAVVAVYFYTGEITYLIGGMIGSALIFGPMFLRWAREHKSALAGKPNSAKGDGQ